MTIYLIIIIALLMLVKPSTAQCESYMDLVETNVDDPNWALVTSDGILREDICIEGWYEKVFNPCYYNINKYWKLEPYAKIGRSFPISLIGIGTTDSLYVREGFEFQLYYNTEEPNDPNDLLPASPHMTGPQYVSLTWWRDHNPPPNGFEPGTFFVWGLKGDLSNYSIVIYAPPFPLRRCEIVNSGFEFDKYIGDINMQNPYGWDVNMPTDKFSGYVDDDWVTDANYNLTLYTKWVTLDANDTATVSQEVDLTDANEIIFDLRLDTDLFEWDQSKVRAIVLIDDEVVWDSNGLGSGEYYDQSFTVEDKYRDGELHTVSFGMRVKVSEKLWRTYYTHWDDIECTLCCGGFGFLPGDFSQNCCVDFIDFAMLANYWLEENPPWPYDLVEDGIIDFNDLEVFVEDWLECSNQENSGSGTMMSQENTSQSMSESLTVTEEYYQAVLEGQKQTQVSNIEVEEILKWLSEIWLETEGRKVITEAEWKKFIENIKNN